MIEYLLFMLGLFLLIKGADLLLEGATGIAKRLKIHSLIVGLTIVAFGTSVPEFFVSIIAASKGMSNLVLGNILGSNISNILLILGISSIIVSVSIKKNTVWKEIPYSLFAALLLLLLSYWNLFNQGDNSLGLIDGIIMLLFFAIFIYYASRMIRQKRLEMLEAKEELDLEDPKTRNMYIISSYIMLGIVGLYFGGSMTVDNATKIARSFGVSEFVISATIIALGTSLPELVVNIKAAIKKESDIAVGNIIGSNIFNILFILGIAVLIRPITMPSFVVFDIIVVMVSTSLLFIFMFLGKRHTLNRWQGWVFLLLYCVYIAMIINK